MNQIFRASASALALILALASVLKLAKERSEKARLSALRRRMPSRFGDARSALRSARAMTSPLKSGRTETSEEISSPLVGASDTVCKPMDEIDLWLAAYFMLKQHGEDAQVFVAQRAATLLDQGDAVGASDWVKIGRALAELQRQAPRPGERRN